MSRPRIILVRHDDDPPDDRVRAWIDRRGYEPVLLRPYAGDSLGVTDTDIAGSVVFGGRFSVFEEAQHPFLHDEHRWIAWCLEQDVPLLGICQGAQSIARVLGAAVGPPPSGVHEFGCYAIRPTAAAGDFLTDPLWVVQNHFHAFDIPSGGVRLAESDLYPNQAFRVGERTYGLQFHPELTRAGFRRWQTAPDAAYGKPGAQTREEQDRLLDEHDAAVDRWFSAFLDGLFGAG